MDDDIPDSLLNTVEEPHRYMIKSQLLLAHAYCVKEEYETAIDLLNTAIKVTKNNLGLSNEVMFFVQTKLAVAYYKQANYKIAQNIMNEVFEKQIKMFGSNSEHALRSQSFMCLILIRLRENRKALKIFREILPKQKEMLGLNHKDTMLTQSSMATCLMDLGINDEAVKLNKELLNLKKDTLGDKHLETLAFQNNLALTYGNLERYDEAIDLLLDVFNKRKAILGMKHSDTLRPLHNIANMYHSQNKYEEAENYYLDALKKQKRNLGVTHIDTLRTQFNLGNLLFQVGRFEEHIKIHRETSEKMKLIIGADHPEIIMMEKLIAKSEIILAVGDSEDNLLLKLLMASSLEDASDPGISVFPPVKSNDVHGLKEAISKKADVNETDDYERTPLHYAVNNGNSEIISILLKNGANIAAVTEKGNTVLHTAVGQGRIYVLHQILSAVQGENLNNLLNGKTTLKEQTALHQACKKCNIYIVKVLLEYGAIFDIKDKDGNTPKMSAGTQAISDLFTLIESFFEDAKCGNAELPSKLKSVRENQRPDIMAIFKAKNTEKRTLIQVALLNNHKDIASALLSILKEIS